MADGKTLLAVSKKLCSELFENIDWNDIWERPLSSGTAFEWAMTAAIISDMKKKGWNLDIPLLSHPLGQYLFTLRNEIPYHHGAQAGHSAINSNQISLADRFLQSLIPKAIFEKDGIHFSLFREGLPYHRISLGIEYHDRPDIVLIEGRPTPGYPKFTEDKSAIEYSFELRGCESIAGQMRIVNSSILPLRKRAPKNNFCTPINGIIECSVNKSYEVSVEQLTRYASLFFVEPEPPIVIVTGNELPLLKWHNIRIDLSADEEGLLGSFQQAAAKALSVFKIGS